MPTSALRLSATASVQVTVSPPPSGVYTRSRPQTVSSPFRWYMPFSPVRARSLRRGLRVLSAGKSRAEKFSPALYSASEQA